MGIQLNEIDSRNIIQTIRLYRSSLILKWIPEYLINAEVYLEAVKANGLALKHVPDSLITERLCDIAIVENHQAFWFVPKRFRHPDMAMLAVNSLISQLKSGIFYNRIGSKEHGKWPW